MHPLRTELDSLVADVAPLREAVDRLHRLRTNARRIVDTHHTPTDGPLDHAIVRALQERTKPFMVRSLDLWRAVRNELCARGVRLAVTPAPSKLDDVLTAVAMYLDALELHDALLPQPAEDSAEH